VVVQRRPVGEEVTAENFELVMTKWRDHPEFIWRGITGVAVVPLDPPSPPAAACSATTKWKRTMTVNEHVAGRAFADRISEANVVDVSDFSASRSRVEFAPVLDPCVSPLRLVLPKFYPKATKFAFTWSPGELTMEAVLLEDEQAPEFAQRLGYIGSKLLAKLESWGKAGTKYKKQAHLDQLFPKDVYQATYSRLKEKYRDWTKRWQSRKLTDKYVHEDLGIAAYFLCLAEDQRKRTGITAAEQTFVDLGCGNGLLVNILTEEGYTGYGIDLNERHVWEMYDRTKVDLRATRFDPSTASFPGVRWIIGNQFSTRESSNCRLPH
jgi:hypothetical protein